jgi:hypothetical protein
MVFNVPPLLAAKTLEAVNPNNKTSVTIRIFRIAPPYFLIYASRDKKITHPQFHSRFRMST